MIEQDRRSRPRPARFQAAEVGDVADAVGVLNVARDLERVAIEGVRGNGGRLDPAFASGVMTAIAAEPLPAPLTAARAAVSAGRLRAAFGAVGDMLRVVLGADRPLVVRAPGLALATLLAVGVGLGASSVAGRLASLPAAGGEPSLAPGIVAGTVAPETPDLTPSPSPATTLSAAPAASASASPRATAAPSVRTTATPRPTRRPSVTATPRPSPEPTGTAESTGTPEPTSTPESGGSDGGGTATPGSGG